ncbi:MAG: Crp/Fnr family transcriptional regulator [Defluviitaleaceae bacterium]|nr:Crp/Fnr family transcriptional regulator [Defluviitaleaceae bacterium]
MRKIHTREIFNIAKDNPLFYDIIFIDFDEVLHCLSCRVIGHKKDDIILLAGDTINYVGLILSGGVKILREDINGNATIVTRLGVSEIFGEVFSCAEVTHSPVTVRADENTEILCIDYNKIITSCAKACRFHTQLIKNMLKLLAEKNLMLYRKNEILSKRTIREKLLCFLNQQRGTSKKFTIPFNRGEMADYLCIHRSAMYLELCKMRTEGLIEFKKNTFEIL